MALQTFPYKVVAVTSLTSIDFDSVVVVTDSIDKLKDSQLHILKPFLEKHLEVDKNLAKEGSVLRCDALPGKRLVFSPTGSLNHDYNDVRSFSEAAISGIERCLKAGGKRPLLVRPHDNTFPRADLVTLLGALHGLYVPLEMRECKAGSFEQIEILGIWGSDEQHLDNVVKVAQAVESGRIVARDIGGSDPERMAPPKVAEYVEEVFKNSDIKVTVISDQDHIDEHYPLLGAVNRATKGVPRHHARVIKLIYEGHGTIDTTVMLVGKGVCYDTGGADVKCSGNMSGMHRDKCGAAAVAGFFKILSILKPSGLKVVGTMAMVRNSIGSNCYVSDEIITARSGVRVRVGNTDAEGRMAMSDPLCEYKDQALSEINPHLFTIATLTGHAIIAYGENYTAVLDNGPARKERFAENLQAVGDELADPFEISTIRREDYKFCAGKTKCEDVLQGNNAPSARTPRGHQFPAAFMIQTSGLAKHGGDSKHPIKYSHLDIAGSSGHYPGVPTGAPIIALAGKYIFPRI